MLKSFTLPTGIALALAMAAGLADAQVIREGARRTGEAVAEGSRAVAQGTRSAINRTGQATRNVIGGTTDAARAQVDRLQRSELQPGVSARANANLDSDPDARIQGGAEISNQQYDNSMQAPMPGDPNVGVQGEYQSGYRGLNDAPVAPGQTGYQGRVYQLRHDRFGREYICVGGRAVYFDNQQQSGQPQQREAYKLNQGEMTDHGRMDYQQQGRAGYRSNQYQGAYGPQGAPQAPPAPPSPNLNDSSIQRSSVETDTNINADQQTDLNQSVRAGEDSALGTASDADIDSATSDVDAAVDTDVDSGDIDSSADELSSSTEASADIEADTSSDDSVDQSSTDSDNSNE